MNFQILQRNSGVDIMCKVMDEMKDKKEKETKLNDIKSIMETLALTAEQAMDALRFQKRSEKSSDPNCKAIFEFWRRGIFI